MKVTVLGDEDATVFARQLPHFWIRRAAAVEQPHMQGVRKHVPQLPDQSLRQGSSKSSRTIQAEMPIVRRSRSAA